jgi:hypothetical protein
MMMGERPTGQQEEHHANREVVYSLDPEANLNRIQPSLQRCAHA